jgi:hypothetical protein
MTICHEGINYYKPVTARKKSTSSNSILTSFALNTSHKPSSYSNWRQTLSISGHLTVKTMNSFTELTMAQTKIKFLTINSLWLEPPLWCFFPMPWLIIMNSLHSCVFLVKVKIWSDLIREVCLLQSNGKSEIVNFYLLWSKIKIMYHFRRRQSWGFEMFDASLSPDALSFRN